MKNTLVVGLVLLFILLASCGSNEFKEYTYIETKSTVFSGNKDNQQTIKAKSDTAAYLDAYNKFIISEKIANDSKNSQLTFYPTPLYFKLIDPEGNDITDINFVTKAKSEEEISKRVSAMPNTIANTADKPSNVATVDTIKVKELSKFFRTKKDEFSTTKSVWYFPKTSPQYTNANGLYLYFSTVNGEPSNLRFRFQYYADDWLFIEYIIFSIDDRVYNYYPTKVDRDNDSNIWEWFDDSATADLNTIIALANAKNAKMKIIGRQYHKVKPVTSAQIKSMKQTLELYKAMGGKL